MLLSEMLYKHYKKKVIVLIDEYDVPLDKAYENQYYEDMIAHIRSVFEMVLKTNEFLQFAVLTGCLRISKESILTGLNNFKVRGISDIGFSEYFGFTDIEVKELLAYYNLENSFATMKEWYDGYRFGETEVYYPWDVLNYCAKLSESKDSLPEAYWANSSSNEIVRNLIEAANGTVKNEIEALLAGETIEKEIIPELTYHALETDEKMIYLWSVLFASGYLTQVKKEKNSSDLYRLKIPNLEIKQIFERQINIWFQKVIRSEI